MAVAAGIAAAIALVSEGSIDPEVQRTPAQG
jgi:hypothetical protein